MRITPAQEVIINSLKCERLSSDVSNLQLVDDFLNRRNPSLALTLQNEAFEEDEHGSIAYYVVKDKSDNILFFFSLKNGLLYDRHIDTKVIELIKKLNTFIQENLHDNSLDHRHKATLISIQEKIRSHKGLSKYDLINLPKIKHNLFKDMERELNHNVTHVGKTYSAIELVHFCSNNNYDSLWDSFNLPQSRGVIIFWKFVVPIILAAKRIIGIQYLFLFAADISDTDSLIRYYQSQLNFLEDTDKATVKPLYDLACKFMYQ